MPNQYTNRSKKKPQKKSAPRRVPSHSPSVALGKLAAYMESKFAEMEERLLAKTPVAAVWQRPLQPTDNGAKTAETVLPPPVPHPSDPQTYAGRFESSHVPPPPPPEALEVDIIEVLDDGELPQDRDTLVKLANDMFVAAQTIANKVRSIVVAADTSYMAQKKAAVPKLSTYDQLTPAQVAIGLGACRGGDAPSLPADQKAQAWVVTTRKAWVLEKLRIKGLISYADYEGSANWVEEALLAKWPYERVRPLIEAAIDWTKLNVQPPLLDDRPQTEEERLGFDLEFDIDPEYAETPEA